MHPATQIIESTPDTSDATRWLLGTGMPYATATALLREAHRHPEREQAAVPWAHRVKWTPGQSGAWHMFHPAHYTIARPHPAIAAQH